MKFKDSYYENEQNDFNGYAAAIVAVLPGTEELI